MDLHTLSESRATTTDRELIVSRVVNAPRPLVWKAWTTPGHIERWWGPNGFTTTTSEMDARPGGTWRYVMHGPDGTDYPNRIVYRELRPVDLMRYRHDSGTDDDAQAFETTVTFDAEGDRTLVTMQAVFPSAEQLRHVIDTYGALEGGKQTLARMEDFVLADTRLSLFTDGNDIVVTRLFAAPPAQLFRAWTTAAHLQRWFGGPEGFSAPVCEVDARPGGRWRLVMRSPEGMDYPLAGTFRELLPHDRIVLTASVAEHPAEWHAWLRALLPAGSPAPSTEMVWTVTFMPLGERTRMSVRLHLENAAVRDAYVRGGTELGWAASTDRLLQLLPSL